MNWKKLIFEDFQGKLIPMGGAQKKLTRKAKFAFALIVVATLVGALRFIIL